MTAKSRASFPGVGARCIGPAWGGLVDGLVGGQVVGAAGGISGCRCPLSVLDLANNRVLPYSPHPSSGGEWAGRPCSETGSAQGSVGFAPPAASVASRGQGRHLLAGGDGRVPGDAAGDDDEQLAQQRAAMAARAWPALSGLAFRVVRCSKRAV